MRSRTFAVLAALAVVDVAVLGLGYRAHTGSLPPLHRTSAAFEVDPTADPTDGSTGTATDGDIVGPVLLGVNASGVVVRATRGACEERFDNPARIWTGNLDDAVAPAAAAAPMREVLGLMVYADGTMRVSGLDLDDEGACVPVTYDSDDGGATWEVSDDEVAIWRLRGDVTASAVTNPRGGEVDVSCEPVQIVNLPARRAVASCSEDTYFMLPQGEQDIDFTASGYTQLSAAPGSDDAYYVFGETASCPASLGVSRPPDQSADEVACFDEDKAPLAVASAGALVLIQLGNDLMVSRDDGESFDTVVEETPAASS